MRSIYRKHSLYMKHFFQMAQQLLLLTAYLNNSLRFHYNVLLIAMHVYIYIYIYIYALRYVKRYK